MIKKNRLSSLLFQNRSIIGYLKISVQLIIVVDLQINQCKFSINLLAFSLLTKVNSQSKSKVNLTKVHSQLNITILNHVHSFTSKIKQKLINQSTFLINSG